jgi:uncharacterized membrane protein (UPF0127 family)
MVSKEVGARLGALTLLLMLFLGSCAAGRNEAGDKPGDPEQGEGGDLSALFGAVRARVLFPDGRVFLAEVADTPAERARGLMYRERLEPKLGMVFVFEEPDLHSFWMKNTHISLDILWLDRWGRVVHIERGVPPCVEEPCPGYTPLRAAAGVLEVAAGQAGALRLGERLLVAREAAPTGL